MTKKSYKIKPYSKKSAKALGVTIKRSTRKGKKIDVFKNGKKVASIGAIGYNDYPTWIELEKKGKVPKGTASKRRKAYKIRHQNNRFKIDTPGYFADQILW